MYWHIYFLVFLWPHPVVLKITRTCVSHRQPHYLLCNRSSTVIYLSISYAFLKWKWFILILQQFSTVTYQVVAMHFCEVAYTLEYPLCLLTLLEERRVVWGKRYYVSSTIQLQYPPGSIKNTWDLFLNN